MRYTADFPGYSDLSSNQLGDLPSGLFDMTSSLTELKIRQSTLSSLPVGIFDQLQLLQSL